MPLHQGSRRRITIRRNHCWGLWRWGAAQPSLAPIRIPTSVVCWPSGRLDQCQSAAIAGGGRDLEDLRQLLLIQGLGWSDVEILDAAGPRTYTTAPQYLFRLRRTSAFSCFPGGLLLEGESQEAHRAGREIVLDPHLLIS